MFDRFKHEITVKFNKHCGHPMMTENWVRVREVFKILGSRLMLFTYLGGNVFFVDVYYDDDMGLNKLSSGHSFHLSVEQPRRFFVTLTGYAATGEYLMIYLLFCLLLFLPCFIVLFKLVIYCFFFA